MSAFTREQLEGALQQLGMQEGDTIFLHSDLMQLGLPQGLNSRDQVLNFYLNTFKNLIGDMGTIAVPAYYYEYARYGEPFDSEHSPISKSLGAFSAFICAQPGRVRSCNPIQSIASIGYKAVEISGGSSLSGYGVNSPWHKLLSHGAKMFFLGVDMQVMTFVHYIEQLVGVPHLYFKIFNVPVLKHGNPIAGWPISAVRYLDFYIEYDLKPFEKLLFEQGKAKLANVGQGTILSTTFEAAYQTGIACLEKNPYFFLKKPPQFVAGKIPNDGPTGR